LPATSRKAPEVSKLKPMFADSKGDVAGRLAGQKTGEFYFLRAGEAIGIRTHPSLIATEQLPEEKILQLARGSTPVPASQAGP